MKCEKCGTEIRQKAKFCPSCGNPIDWKEKPKKKMSKKMKALIVLVFVLVIGGIVYTKLPKTVDLHDYTTTCKVKTLTVDRTYTIDLGDGKTTTVVGHYEREMEEEMFNAVNEYRRENNKKELESGYYKLKNAADIRGYEISYYFEHNRPNGERALVSFSHMSRCCGENIARGQISVKKAMYDFKNSPAHNDLMLSTYPEVLSISVFAKYEGTVNGKKQYSLHYVQFYGIKLAASQQ